VKVLILGASGFIGKALVAHLVRTGHEVIAVVRHQKSAESLPCKAVVWDSTSEDVTHLGALLWGMDAVINLAGESVAASRWTPAVKTRLTESRVSLTKKVVDALKTISPDKRPGLYLSGSAIGYYGDCGDELIDESSGSGTDFLARLCQSWEHEAQKAEDVGVRVIRLRTGVVLGQEGGALEVMQPIILGNGHQWMSWIHLEDVVRFIDFALTQAEAKGVYNLTAPSPERNREFTQELARARGVTLTPSLPKIILEALMGERASVVLTSSKVLPKRILQQGFQFKYPTLKEALQNIYPKGAATTQVFSSVQFVSSPIEEVFPFFSAAENLEEITPPWLKFRVVGKSTSSIEQNTLIDYRLKIHGFPTRWQSKIESWTPNFEFTDTQTKGPYSLWRHVHRFESVPGGVLMSDQVTYRVPGGRLGKAVLSPFIRREVEEIFAYRRKKIQEKFDHRSIGVVV
jgi:uncharacterized protein (TIGR01777 family)